MKFRAYCPEVKKIIHFYNPEITNSKDNVLGIFIPVEGGKMDFGEYIFSFFSGLKECTGKDIYERDIIEVTSHGIRIGELDVVVFKNGCFMLKSLDIPIYQYLEKYPFDINIIGNIYENPDLI